MINRIFLFFLGSVFAASAAAQEDFFREAIAHDCVPSAVSFDKSLKISQIGGERERLWGDWCRAVRTVESQALPEFEPLESKKSGVLLLPDSLDKANEMPYYWGFKGDLTGEKGGAVPSVNSNISAADGGAPSANGHVSGAAGGSSTEKGVASFLCLHGSGERDAEWEANYSWALVYDDAPARYIIPQTPLGGPCRWYFRSRQWAWRWMWLQLTALHGADANRMYMFGISEGGYGSQRMASFFADYLAGAGPMAGGEPLENCPPENLRHTAFSLLSGENDYMYCRNQLVEIAAMQLDSLQQQCPGDYVHRVALQPGRGHGIDYRPTTPWLRQYTRRTHPRHVTWEDFAMDGVRRRGFYNIRVLERPEGSDRLRWDMDIEGDTVRVTIRRVTYAPAKIDSVFGMTLVNEKTYRPAVGGRFTLYLDEKLVDIQRPVTVVINGRVARTVRLRPNRRHMMESLATWLDPERIYPCALDLRF